MRKSDLILFKEKHKSSEYFIGVVSSMLLKLVEFGYIPNSKLDYYPNRLTSNVNYLKLATNNQYDFKSGYYDANKKELYIKDEKDIPSVFLRLLDAITTTETDKHKYMCGYSITKMSKTSYKLDYKNYGFNRAVMSNLVYKLCNLVPHNLQIVTTKPTYTHNFLGYKIEAENDMYSLEGKILSEMCYCLDLDPEILYAGLFSKNPIKYLDNIFTKKNFKEADKFLHLLDKISKKYNTYNKLAYLSQKLNDNYIEYKKNVLNENVKDILKEQKLIENEITSVLSSLNLKQDDQALDNEQDIEVISSLAETIENLDSELKELLIKIQDILAEQLIESAKNLAYSKYANKLKYFNDILIVPNKKVAKKIEEIILFKLMPETEVTGINLIQKIKYAIIEQILANKDYSDISATFSFYNITNLEDHDNGSALIILNSPKSYARVMEVKGLDTNTNNYKTEYIPLDNFKHIVNTGNSNIFVGDIEKLCTALRNSFSMLNNISLENLFVFEYNNNKYILAYANNEVYVISFTTQAGYNFKMLTLSENYKVFGKDAIKQDRFKSNLPVLYKR